MPHRLEQSLTPLPETVVWPEEVIAIRSAIADRDLAGVQQAFSRWLGKDPSDRFNKDFFVTCLAAAVEAHHPAILSYLLSQDIPFYISHVQVAVEGKSERILEVFLRHGWEINQAFSWDTPPLLSKAIMDENLTRWFLVNGADPNAECSFDFTPLSVAVIHAPFSIIQLLFEYGGTAQHGQLIHHAATRMEPDRLEVLDFIISKGAVGLNSLLHEHRPSNYKMMEAFGLGTPLHAAAEKGLLDTVQYLLGKGASSRIRDSRGQLAIDCAEYEQHYDVVEILRHSI